MSIRHKSKGDRKTQDLTDEGKVLLEQVINYLRRKDLLCRPRRGSEILLKDCLTMPLISALLWTIGIIIAPMSEKPEPQFDYRRIHYPSDAITIGKLRAVSPLRLDVDRPRFIDEIGMLTVERLLARRAFDATLGRAIPDADDSNDGRNVWVHALGLDYKRYGVARGPKTALHLIKAFEAEAVAQAREHLGRTR